MSTGLEPMVSDSNWIFCYVIIAATPVVFFCVALFSVWQDRRRQASYDVGAIQTAYGKYWGTLQHDYASSASSSPGWTKQQAGGRPKTYYVPTLAMNRVGPRLSGFPVSAASQLPRFGTKSPRSDRVPAPAWTGGDSGPSNYAGMHSINV